MTEAGTAVSIDTGTDELLCALRERVAIPTLNRPHARNSLSERLSPALRRMIAAFAFARRLANGPATALAMMKATLNEAADQSFERSLHAEAVRLVRSARTADHKEAVAAFVAKRAPVFGA